MKKRKLDVKKIIDKASPVIDRTEIVAKEVGVSFGLGCILSWVGKSRLGWAVSIGGIVVNEAGYYVINKIKKSAVKEFENCQKCEKEEN